MRYLFDTNVLYRAFYEPEKLSDRAHSLIGGATSVSISAASIWEIAIKARLGKLKAVPERILSFVKEGGFTELPVYARHTILVASMPLFHRDPFDRLLIAQAMTENLQLLTTDPKMSQYSALVIQV